MILPKPALQVARIQNANIMVFIRVSPQTRRAGGHNQKASSHHASAWHCKLSIGDTLVFSVLPLLRWIKSRL